jgi:hypothetical protein
MVGPAEAATIPLLERSWKREGSAKRRCSTDSSALAGSRQNHENFQYNLEDPASRYAAEGKKDRDIELLAQMLIRAYDP